MKLVRSDVEQISMSLAVMSFLFDRPMSIIHQVIIKQNSHLYLTHGFPCVNGINARCGWIGARVR